MTDRGPVRLAYLMSSLQIGGAERRVLSLVERMPRDRFDVTFLCSSGAGPLGPRALEAGASIQLTGSVPVSGRSLPVKVMGRVSKVARYVRLARHARFDIVNALLYPDDVICAMCRFMTRTRVIVAERADILPRHQFGPISGQTDAVANRLVDAVVANSHVVAQVNRDRYGVDPAKLHVIRNGVEQVEPISASERRAIRATFGARDDDVLIGAVGMLREVKRHALLIEAFSDLVRHRSDVSLVIVGEGPMRPSLERQVSRSGLESRVRLPGAVADTRPLLDAFDIVALSSESEGLPNVLLEASAAGRAIVTTAAGGAIEIVLDGATGLVTPVGDRAALAQALTRLAADGELRERLGRTARERVATEFSMERHVADWCALYERLAAAKDHRPG